MRQVQCWALTADKQMVVVVLLHFDVNHCTVRRRNKLQIGKCKRVLKEGDLQSEPFIDIFMKINATESWASLLDWKCVSIDVFAGTFRWIKRGSQSMVVQSIWR